MMGLTQIFHKFYEFNTKRLPCLRPRNKCWFIVLVFIAIFIYFTDFTQYHFLRGSHYLRKERIPQSHRKYLINTSNCKIPDLDPFNDDVKPYLFKEPYTKCTDLGLLTYIDKSGGIPKLKINKTVLPHYAESIEELNCCCSRILRSALKNNTDNGIRKSTCIPFVEEIILRYPYTYVTCVNANYKTVYTNVHATALLTEFQRESQNYSSKNKPYNIFLVGIDSMSRLNLIRTMPKTHNYLEKNFMNLNGYNKIADNTFPNLMAILSGMSKAQLYKKCNPDHRRMDYCDFLWDDLKQLGYITGYAEDECLISTFNYQNWGFEAPPTDLYYRPYMLAAEQLPLKEKYNMYFCTGPETSGERIMNIAKDFAITFHDTPNFGLFWMNSFSHENINCASAMDEKVLEFLQDNNLQRSLENSMFVFFSDHGFRFGDMRYTHSGWLEERLPFIYILLPKTFHKKYSKEYANFVANTKRLTTPYDLYLTLQDLVHLTEKEFVVKPSKACPKCQSMFREIGENRTCEDAAIEQHWCTCKVHAYVNPKDIMAEKVGKFVISQINKLIQSNGIESDACATYKLRRTLALGKSEEYLNEQEEKVNYYLIIFETLPSAMFEATAQASPAGDKFKLLGDISRINKYSGSSYCVSNKNLQKYCYCDGFVTKIKSAFCQTFNYCI